MEPEIDRMRSQGATPVAGHLLADADLARHHPERLAHAILEQVAADLGAPEPARGS